MPRGNFASTNQKHYPALGSDTSSVWNFCACPASRKSRLFSRLKGFEKYFSFTFFTGFLLAISCGIYPSGWGSVEFKQVCGDEANFYKLGHCKLSWAFFVYVSGTGIAFMCAALSARVAKQRKPLYIRTDVERSNSFM